MESQNPTKYSIAAQYSKAVQTKSLDSGRVLYIEPNTMSAGKFGYDASQKMIPNPEDFSIFVDLEVITYDRFTGQETKMSVSYDGSQTNVMSGSRISTTVEKRFLTTSILDTSFEDVQNGNNPEGLCIDSIDISYNSYNFPEVNIKFTDIRGVSLMSPSDYYSTADDVISGVGKEKNADFFAKSFVSTFFRFPYPRFMLRVKGFYGYPVTYELCVNDFKTSFNKSTGNFDIYVKFIGYMFGCLTDIPIRLLIFAPFEESIGAEYWKKKIESGEFTYDNGSPMLDFLTFNEKIKTLSTNVTEDESIRNLVSDVSDLTTKQAAVQSLRNSVHDYVNKHPYSASIRIENQNLANVEEGSVVERNEWDMLFLPIPNIVRASKETTGNYITIGMGLDGAVVKKENVDTNAGDIEYKEIGDARIKVNECCQKYSDVFKTQAPEIFLNEFSGKTNETYCVVLEYKNGYLLPSEKLDDAIDGVYGPTTFNEGNTWNQIRKNIDNFASKINDGLLKEKGYYIKVNGKDHYLKLDKDVISKVAVKFLHTSNFDKFCDDILSPISESIDAKENEVKSAKEERIVQLLGFNPTIKNIMDMVLAHLDTFMETMYRTVENIKSTNRTVGSVIPGDIENTDLPNSGGNKTALPPFFTLLHDTRSDGVPKKEEKWLGIDSRTRGLGEVNYVNSFLKGVIRAGIDYSKALEEIEHLGETKGEDVVSDTEAVFPLGYDALLGINPYSKVTNGNTGDGGYASKDLMNALFTLRLLVATYAFKGDKDLTNRFAELEAEAFAKTDMFKSNIGGVQEAIESIHDSGDKGKNEFWERYLSGEKSPFTWLDGKAVVGPVNRSGQLRWNGFPLLPTSILSTKEGISPFITKTDDGKTSLYPAENITSSFELIDSDIPEEINTNISKFVDGYNGVDSQKVATLKPIRKSVDDWRGLGGRSFLTNRNNFVVLEQSGNSGILDNLLKGCYKETYRSSTSLENKTLVIDKEKYSFTVSSKLIKDMNLASPESYPFIRLPFADSGSTVFLDDIFLKQNVLGKAFVFLHTLPTANASCLASFSRLFNGHGTFQEPNYTTKWLLASLPKSLVLFAGALYWREASEQDIYFPDDVKPETTKRCLITPGGGQQGMYEFKTIKKTDKNLSYYGVLADDETYNFYGLRSDIKNVLISFFKNWVENDFQNNILPYFYNSEIGSATTPEQKLAAVQNIGTVHPSGLKNDYPTYFRVSYDNNDNIMQVVFNPKNEGVLNITRLLFTPCTLKAIYPASFAFGCGPKMNDVFTLKENTAKEVYGNFINALYDKLTNVKLEEKSQKEEIEQTDSAESTDAVKLGLYQVFRNIYNKWLISTPREHFVFKKNRSEYSHNAIGKQFVYINTYYERIDNSVVLNLAKVGETIDKALIRNVAALDSQNMSLYTMIYDFAAASNIQLLALPIFNDFGDDSMFENIFTPLSYESFAALPKEAGNTYVFIYTEKASSNAGISGGVNDSDILYKYRNDSFLVCDNNKWELSHDIPSSFATEGVGEKVKCFGVSFARGNQSFFRGIDVSMDNPKTTEYAIANQFMLASNFSSEPNVKPTVGGQSLFKIYSNYAYQASVEMMGCPSIMPLMYFQLNNVPMFKGTYIIINVKHSIRPGDMTTIFTGQRLSRERTEYSKDIGLSLPAKVKPGNYQTSSTSPSTYKGGDSSYTLNGEAVNSQANFYLIAQREGGINDVKVLWSLKRVLSGKDNYSGTTEDKKPIVVGPNKETDNSGYGDEKAFYGLWRLRGSFYKKAGCEDFETFLKDEGDIIENQSTHFGKVVKNDGLSTHLNNKNWGKFYDGYFGNNYKFMAKKDFINEMNNAMELYEKTSTEETNREYLGVVVYTEPVFDQNPPEGIPAFDVQGAVEWEFNNMVKPYGIGACARYVRTAVQVGGGLMIPHPEKACQYIEGVFSGEGTVTIDGKTYKKSDLWTDITQNVKTSPSQSSAVTPINCQPGDIAVFECTSQHPSGHIQICLGKDEKGNSVWGSDFFQPKAQRWHACKNMPDDAVYYVFRYRNRQSYSKQI